MRSIHDRTRSLGFSVETTRGSPAPDPPRVRALGRVAELLRRRAPDHAIYQWTMLDPPQVGIGCSTCAVRSLVVFSVAEVDALDAIVLVRAIEDAVDEHVFPPIRWHGIWRKAIGTDWILADGYLA